MSIFRRTPWVHIYGQRRHQHAGATAAGGETIVTPTVVDITIETEAPTLQQSLPASGSADLTVETEAPTLQLTIPVSGSADITVVTEAPSLVAAPTITDVDTDEIVLDGQTSVAVTGTDMGADENARTFDLVQGSVEVAQTETGTGTSTAATLTIGVSDAGADDISFGSATLRVTRTSDSSTGELAVTVNPPTGQLYVDIGTPNTTADNRITATGDIASGDQIQARGEGGGAAPTGLTLNTDGTFYFTSGNDPQNFDVRVWDSSDATWGAWATQTINSLATPAVVNIIVITESPTQQVVLPAGGSADLTVETEAPTIFLTVLPETGDLTVETEAPTLQHTLPAGGSGDLTVETEAPTLLLDVPVSPSTVDIDVVTGAPTVVQGDVVIGSQVVSAFARRPRLWWQYEGMYQKSLRVYRWSTLVPLVKAFTITPSTADIVVRTAAPGRLTDVLQSEQELVIAVVRTNWYETGLYNRKLHLVRQRRAIVLITRPASTPQPATGEISIVTEAPTIGTAGQRSLLPATAVITLTQQVPVIFDDGTSTLGRLIGMLTEPRKRKVQAARVRAEQILLERDPATRQLLLLTAETLQKTIRPAATADIIITVFKPTEFGRPSVVNITVETEAPTVSFQEDGEPTTGDITIETEAPDLVRHALVSPGAAEIVVAVESGGFTGFEEIVTAGGGSDTEISIIGESPVVLYQRWTDLPGASDGWADVNEASDTWVTVSTATDTWEST